MIFSIAKYSGLNEHDPHRFLCSNSESPAGGTGRERLGGMASLEEACHWGPADFEVSKAHSIPS